MGIKCGEIREMKWEVKCTKCGANPIFDDANITSRVNDNFVGFPESLPNVCILCGGYMEVCS